MAMSPRLLRRFAIWQREIIAQYDFHGEKSKLRKSNNGVVDNNSKRVIPDDINSSLFYRSTRLLRPL